MKLQQLFEYQFPQIRVREVSKLPGGYNYGNDMAADRQGFRPNVMKRGGDNVKHLGTGHFASAYVNKDMPHDVRKVSRPNDINDVDGFYFYIMELSKFKNNGNPYFPRFGSVTVYKHTKDARDNEDDDEEPITNVVYSAQIERLKSIETVTPKMNEAIFQRLFGDNIDNVSRGASLSSIVQRVVHNYDAFVNNVVDKDLLEAAAFVRNVADKHNLDIDLHAQNVMLRGTPYGDQIVITDPLSFQTS